MQLPEGYLPRRGDELLIRVRAKSDATRTEDCFLEIVGQEYTHFFMGVADIHSLYCRKWSEGDKVTTGEFEGPGTVIAATGEYVWVRQDTGSPGLMWTVEANELEPYVEPEELAVEK